jgi:hypothetical protein
MGTMMSLETMMATATHHDHHRGCG